MLKRLNYALLLGLAALFVACSGEKTPEEPVVLTLYTWPDYFPREVIRQFQKEYGIRVNVEEYLSNEAMMMQLERDQEADVILPSDFMVEILTRKGLLQPLNQNLLPNAKYIEERFRNPRWDPEGKFAIPYFYGMTGIAYGPAVKPEDAESWSILFEKSKLEPHRSRVGMLDNKREVIGSALIYLGKSPNTKNEEDINAAAQLLVEQKPFLLDYNSQNYIDQLNAGAIDISQAWSGDILREQAKNDQIGFGVPDEGVIVFIDALSIPANAKHPKAAHKLINFFLRPDIAAQLTEYSYFATTNSAARALLPASFANGPAYDLPPPVTTYVIEDVGRDVDEQYEHVWQSVR